MRKILFNLVVLFGSVVSIASFLTKDASAQAFLPESLQNMLDLMGTDGSGTGEFATSRIRTLMLLGFVILVLAAVIYLMFSVYKYLRSEGDQGQIEEAQKSIRSIVVGFAFFFIGMIGIVLIFTFFGAGLIDSSVYQTCISSPNSPGCLSCKADSDAGSFNQTTVGPIIFTNTGGSGGLPTNWDSVKFNSLGVFVVDARFDSVRFDNGNDNQKLCSYCEWEYFQKSRSGSFSIQQSAESLCEE